MRKSCNLLFRGSRGKIHNKGAGENEEKVIGITGGRSRRYYAGWLRKQFVNNIHSSFHCNSIHSSFGCNIHSALNGSFNSNFSTAASGTSLRLVNGKIEVDSQLKELAAALSERDRS